MSEPDDTVEIPAVTEAVADAIADGDDGPPCGSPDAITSLWVTYQLKSLTHIDRVGTAVPGTSLPKRSTYRRTQTLPRSSYKTVSCRPPSARTGRQRFW